MREEDPKRVWDLTTKVKALVCCCVLLFVNFFETSLSCLCRVSLQLPRKRRARLISSSADLVFLPLVYLALVVLRYIRLQRQTDR